MLSDIEALKVKSKSSVPLSESDDSKILSLEKDLKQCLHSLNMREQYARCWAVRITGLIVPKILIEKHGVVIACLKHAYKVIFQPVLLQAVNQGSIPRVPEWQELFENGHFLKSRGAPRNFPPPIIIRFSSRLFRNLFLTLKRGNMPQPNRSERLQGVSYYIVTPDLTSTNWRILKSLRTNPKVEAAWSNDTKLLFRLKKFPDVVHLVTSIHTDIDELINRAMQTVGGTPDDAQDDAQEASPCDAEARQQPFTPAITRSQKISYENNYGARPKRNQERVRGRGGRGGRGVHGGQGSRGRREQQDTGTGGRGHRGRRHEWCPTPSSPPLSGSSFDWSTVTRRNRPTPRLQRRSVSPDLYRLPNSKDKSSFQILSSQSDTEL